MGDWPLVTTCALVGALIAAVTFSWLAVWQVRMARLHKERAFTFLLINSIFSIIGTLLAVLPAVVELADTTYSLLMLIYILLLLLSAITGMRGVFLLFRKYGELAARVDPHVSTEAR